MMILYNGTVRLVRESVLSDSSVAAVVLFAVYLLSLPPKWATLHISALMLVVLLLSARRDDWLSPALRSYAVITCAWLVPLILVSVWQNLSGLSTATTWVEVLKLALRMLGVGLGILLLLQRGWISMQTAVRLVLSVLALNAIVGFFEWIPRIESLDDAWRQYRMEGLAKNPNPFGTFMAIAVILAAGLLKGRVNNGLLWMVLVLSGAAIWASGSRGAILVAVVGLFVLYYPRDRSPLFPLAVLLAGGGVVAWQYLSGNAQIGISEQLRIDAFRFTISKIQEAPWVGWGKEAFMTMQGRPDVNAPHNMLLDLVFCAGLLPLIGWLLSTAWLVISLGRRSAYASRVMQAILLAAIVAGVLEYSLINSTHYQGVWVLVTAFSCWVLYGNTPSGDVSVSRGEHQSGLVSESHTP